MKDTTAAAAHDAAPPNAAPHAAAKTPARRGRPKGAQGAPRHLAEGASADAKRLAAAILEVLAGARTPTEAAQTLALSLPRYYILEDLALQGMLVACEPRRVGRGPSPESALASLRRECEQLRRECTRQQTLVRAAQRSIGLPPPAPPPRTPPQAGKKRRPRRPTARALRAAARLKQAERPPDVTLTPAAAATLQSPSQ
jgi:hypothetical protein